jgi:hypothetical protein
MTQHPDLFAALAAPFADREVKVRVQAGRELHYVTARTVMNRLDTVLGPENWWDEYVPAEHSVLCRLSIRLPEGGVLTKCDAGAYAGLADQGTDDKSGYSDAFKRAAVKFGCGRYLYRDGVAEFVREDGEPIQSTAAPEAEPRAFEPPAPRQAAAPAGDGPVPRSGRGLFAWLKDQEQKHEVVLLRYMNNWGKLHEFPARIVDWDAEQVAQAHAEAVRKLRALLPDPAESQVEALAN